jgi:hypothetical protein
MFRLGIEFKKEVDLADWYGQVCGLEKSLRKNKMFFFITL